MGKDKTDSIAVDIPNTKNDKKKFIENKENSIKSSKSIGPPKFTLKVRSDLTAEVLEDENTNESLCSTNSKSNKAAPSSTASSSSEATDNSSSTSNKNKHNKRHKDIKSNKNKNINDTEHKEKKEKENKEKENKEKENKEKEKENKEKEKVNKEKENKEKEKETEKQKQKEENNTQFRIASQNPTGFKLRIVPLEKLLEKPPPPPPKPATQTAKVVKIENTPQENTRSLLKRRSKPVSFIELSDSEDEEVSEEEIEKNSKGNKKRQSKEHINTSESEEDDQPNKSFSKRKSTKKSSSSDSEDIEPKKSLSKRKTDNKSASTDTEKGEPIKSNNTKKLTPISSDSDFDELTSKSKKSNENNKNKENKNKKSTTESVESETGESEKSSLCVKVSSESENNKAKNSKTNKNSEDRKLAQEKSKKLTKLSEPIKGSLSSKSTDKVKSNSVSSKEREKQTSDSEGTKSQKSSSKRKHFEISSSESEEAQIIAKTKRISSGKSLRQSKQSDSIEEHIKPKSSTKVKNQGPPPSPSTVRRCVVRIKRCKLSDFKDLCKNRPKTNMNGSRKSEKPSTSRRKQSSSDEDSDFDFRRAAIAEHDYSGRDLDDDDDEDDKASRNSSDSEIIPTRKRRVFRKDNKDSDNSDSDFEPKPKDKKKKRRVQRNSSDDSDDDQKKSNRKDIRKIIKSDDLNLSTKEAAKQEQDRRKRIEERQKLYNQIYEKPESVEVSELVLDFDTDDGSTLLEVDKGLMKKLKPHQVTGVKFMWDACFETIKYAQEKSGSGCILAHCMGLGKTMQIVTLSHTLLSNSRKTNVERVLIISPLSTLNNWAREFKHWMSFAKKRNIEIFDMSKYKDKATRIFKLNEWFEEGGVCILGYDMYRILANEKAKGLKKKQREQLQKSLVDPGPDMVVCDEGHLLKNEKTSISKAVTRMRTQRRIVLTGTPLQNNLKEYYCMIQFIKPNLLGTYKEYLNRFVNPISNGQYTDSTDRDIRLMKHRSHILHKLLEGCIQRRDYSVLAPYLPPKHEYVVYTTLSILQELLYDHYMVHQRDLSINSTEGKGAKLFKDFQELRRIWTHPMNMRINSDSVIRKKILANESDSMDDFIDDDNNEDEAAESSSDSSDASSKSFASGGGTPSAAAKVVKTRNFRRNAAEEGIEANSDIEEEAPPSQDDPSEWWKRFVADKELNNINHSPKLVILMRLLEQCEAIGDKLLVFSQSLQSLDTIEHFLSLIDSKTRGFEYEGDVGDLKGLWKSGTDYFRLDGSCSVEQRESMCRKFNDSSNLRARLFLISTRAGGLGINLVSANRVVIFDVSWNPSHDTQSIFRVYRFGQVKPCYIYRLIAMGTMEQKLYERQVAKQATAKRVIDEQQISRHYNQSDLQELYTYELKPSVPREIPLLPKDRLFAELLSEHEALLFKYHEHDSLLENEESENLSAEERKAAWSEYEAEKTKAVQTAQFVAYDRSAYGQYGNSAGSVTSNKIFGFRSDVLLQLLNMKVSKDHPEMSQNHVAQVVPAYLQELFSQMNNNDPSMYKDLLDLHATLTHPSGMYMNPLLYVNQNPQSAGYFQSGSAPPANGVGVPPMMGGPPVMVPVGSVPIMGAMPMVAPPPAAVAPAPRFDPNEVYEID